MPALAAALLLSGAGQGSSSVTGPVPNCMAESSSPAQAAPKTKKPKQKKNKTPKGDVLAPDEKEDLDQPTETDQPGFRFVWKQHPSIRYGSAFRMDFQAKFQVDAYDSYDGAQGALACDDTLASFQLYVGVAS